ncbi:A-kinase anchor protein 12 isoform X2 [Dermochelys coriacea]|uniref:A-kinase anchor protein 12 isoform X2 n=1 Tax=Dermochelys coriacea TaxID=27794 RepID=UPI001CA981E4|nr:A-kinase anchor protein 12 isoform X2 [Dermochelys coriacea]
MGAGSSAEQRSPQDAPTAAAESEPASPEAAAAAAAPLEEPEDPAKLLQKNGQISNINGIADEQVELNLQPGELNGQQREAVVTDVGQREPANVIVKEELAENMEAMPPESTDKDGVEDGQKDVQEANEQLPSEEEKVEELEQPSESQSNDVGFKKVFKFVGFKFTVKKDKTEKSEPVQLLTVKKEEEEVAANGAGDHKEVKIETVEEATESEVTHPAEKIEEEPKSEERKDESLPEKVAESPSEEAEGNKETEGKKEPSKSPESPTNGLVNETASPLRKFFTQGWAGFRKKTSFRKPKEDEQQTPEREKEEQEREVAEIPVEASEKEKTEREKEEQEREVAEIPVEASEKEKTEKEKEEQEREVAEIPVDASEKEEIVIPSEQSLPQETFESVIKESEVSFEEKVDLSPEEKSKPVKEFKISLEEKVEIHFEEKSELPAPMTMEIFGEKLEKSKEESEPVAPKTAEVFGEKIEISEPKAPLATEIFDEKLETEEKVHVGTTEEKEVKIEQMPSSASEQSVEGDGELQRIQPTEEQAKETVCIVVDDHIKQTEPSAEDAAACKPPDGITTEVELLSSQERAKVQGSPLKKLFTGTGLKKLSGKKHKGKREETKPGEQAEQIQHLADSPESPEEQKAESSASSPEESTEPPSVEKAIDATRVTETEGVISDVERKRECVTPWASFKKMVTPKKRVRRPSESDKEEEIDKAKSATLSSTESAVSENQEETKVNGEEQKLEKSIEEPKRKVDTSVSWEALICVGSSKKRARKSSSSDEEVGQRLAQEGQKIDEVGQSKETAPDMILTSSQESDQGQGSSSPEQAGSPSEGEGVSTWESFKRLVTPRRKSKAKMEERTEESLLVSSIEHSTSDGEPGKEETWVSLKKLIPGRRKKKSDGKPEQACVEEAGEEMTETNEEDSDVPAVVPLSEYEAAEQEKIEAQQATQAEAIREETLDEKRAEKLEDTLIIEQSNEGLVHAVTVTVVEGERAVTSIEERSPSWISATVTESIEQEKDDEEQTDQIFETEVVVEKTVVVTKTLPELRKDISDDTIVSELELTSEALTALEEATEVSRGEEATEVSLAEETTEMVSAMSQLTESPDTTEEVTPVQELEGTEQNLEELNKQTQEILEEVVERVKLSDEVQMISERTVTGVIQSVQKIGSEMKEEDNEVTVICKETVLVEQPLKKEEPKEADIQHMESAGSVQGRNEADKSVLQEVSEMSEKCAVMKEHTEEAKSLDRLADESQWQETEQAFIERHEETSEVERIREKCKLKEEEFYSGVTITTKAEHEVKSEYVTVVKQYEISTEEAKVNLLEIIPGEITDEGAPEMDGSESKTHETKLELSQEFKQVVDMMPNLESKCMKVTVTEAPLQSEAEDAMLTLESKHSEATAAQSPRPSEGTDIPVQSEREHAREALEPRSTEALVDEAPVLSGVTEAPVKKEVQDAGLSLESKSTEATVQSEVTEATMQSEVEGIATEGVMQSEVTEAPVKKEVEDAVLILESECTETVSSEAPMQRDVTEAAVQSGVEDAAHIVEKECTEALASEVQDAVLLLESKCTETIAAEATVQSEVEEIAPTATVQNEVDDSMLTLESKCTEITAIETTMKSEGTEIPMQSEMEDALLSLESKCTDAIVTGDAMESGVTEAPVKKEVEDAALTLEPECTEAVAAEAPIQKDVEDAPSKLESEYPGAVVNGAPLQSDTYPKELPVHGKGDEEEPMEAKQILLLTATSSNDNQREETKFELMMEVEKDLFESGKLELASGDKLYSTPVQQEISAVQLEDTGSPIPSIESSEAQKASVPVTAAAIEEQIIAETVTSMESSAQTLKPLAAVPEKLFSELVQDIAIAHSGFGAAGSRSEETAAMSVSEMTAATVNGMTEAATSCTQPDLVKKDYVDDATQGKEQQKPECREEAEKKIVSQDKKSPSLTHIEFEKDIVQSVTIESQSTKIVLKIIQTAVDKLERTEEPDAVCMASESQQQIESADGSQKGINISEVLESVQAHQQLLVKGEKTIEGKEQEFQQSSTVKHTILTQSAEKQATLEQTEDVPLISDLSKEGEIQDSGKIVSVPEGVSHESLGAQKSTIHMSVSEDLSKETKTDQPKLKEKEAGQTVATQEKYMVQQTHIERKEDKHSQPVEDMKRHTEEDVNNQEYASCGSPQSKSELTKS